MKDGVRLMGRGSEMIQWPIHLEVFFDLKAISHKCFEDRNHAFLFLSLNFGNIFLQFLN